jgi:hypothetical protein
VVSPVGQRLQLACLLGSVVMVPLAHGRAWRFCVPSSSSSSSSTHELQWRKQTRPACSGLLLHLCLPASMPRAVLCLLPRAFHAMRLTR